jgi:hypothetical protein
MSAEALARLPFEYWWIAVGLRSAAAEVFA